jgi:hypothetical protein
MTANLGCSVRVTREANGKTADQDHANRDHDVPHRCVGDTADSQRRCSGATES